ncbi:MAG: hypothetical protein ABWY78_23110 [Microvirga sp.]
MKNELKRSGGATSLTVLSAVVAFIVLGSAVQAAAPLEPKAADRAATAMAGKDSQAAPSATVDTLPPNCQRSRKKFWVADEGWIVRKVTTCY